MFLCVAWPPLWVVVISKFVSHDDCILQSEICYFAVCWWTFAHLAPCVCQVKSRGSNLATAGAIDSGSWNKILIKKQCI